MPHARLQTGSCMMKETRAVVPSHCREEAPHSRTAPVDQPNCNLKGYNCHWTTVYNHGAHAGAGGLTHNMQEHVDREKGRIQQMDNINYANNNAI